MPHKIITKKLNYILKTFKITIHLRQHRIEK